MHRDLNGRPWMFQRSKVIFLACSCKCKWCELEVTVALVAGIYTCSTQAVPYNTLLVWWNTSYLYMLEVGVGSNTPLLTVSTLNYRPLPRFLSFTVQSCACCPLSPMMLYTSSYFDASQLTTNTGRHCMLIFCNTQSAMLRCFLVSKLRSRCWSLLTSRSSWSSKTSKTGGVGAVVSMSRASNCFPTWEEEGKKNS